LLRNDGTYVQWKYEGDAVWTNLIALADITGANGTNGLNGANGLDGEDGCEVLLQVTATHVQWSYIGGAWVDLIALATLTGAKGDKGDTGDTGPASTVPGPPGATVWTATGLELGSTGQQVSISLVDELAVFNIGNLAAENFRAAIYAAPEAPAKVARAIAILGL
jgi:hypothetical protein